MWLDGKKTPYRTASVRSLVICQFKKTSGSQPRYRPLLVGSSIGASCVSLLYRKKSVPISSLRNIVKSFSGRVDIPTRVIHTFDTDGANARPVLSRPNPL